MSAQEQSPVDMGNYEVLSDARTPECSIRLLRVSKGRAVNLHYHKDTVQIYICLQGSAKARVRGNTYPLQPNDTLRIPSGVPHAMETDDHALLLSISIPPLQTDDQYPVEG